MPGKLEPHKAEHGPFFHCPQWYLDAAAFRQKILVTTGRSSDVATAQVVVGGTALSTKMMMRAVWIQVRQMRKLEKGGARNKFFLSENGVYVIVRGRARSHFCRLEFLSEGYQ
jgi:hypothetical protein